MRIKERGCVRESNLPHPGYPPEGDAAEETRAAINAIPEADLLGVMACPISPESNQECLVCRLVSPEEGVDVLFGEEGLESVSRFAKKYGLTYDRALTLYYAAAYHTAFVEELIADRLDDIVFGKSVA